MNRIEHIEKIVRDLKYNSKLQYSFNRKDPGKYFYHLEVANSIKFSDIQKFSLDKKEYEYFAKVLGEVEKERKRLRNKRSAAYQAKKKKDDEIDLDKLVDE